MWKLNGTETIYYSGNVGIGTTNPTKGKLEISGTGNTQSASNFGYLNNSTPTDIAAGPLNYAYSIWADDKIAALEFNAMSDERIKNIIRVSDQSKDLQTLMNIKVTDYTLKDTIAKGNKQYKKVIAQQVAEVYPQAVSKVTELIPDIYSLAEIKNGWIQLETNLEKGETVQIILEDRKELVHVIETKEASFKVNLEEEGKVFIYGRQVDDFHTVDYEAINMLNVSATQALYQQNMKLEKDLSAAQNENRETKETLEVQQKEIEILKQKLDEILKMLQNQ